MNTHKAKHTVAILTLDNFVPFDLSVPYQLFSLARSSGGHDAYEVCFSGPSDTISSGNFHISDVLPLHKLQCVDTVVIPGICDPMLYNDEAVSRALCAAFARGVRLASICTGACVLAAAGLLDGLSATTHWEIADQLAKKYPQILVEPDILFTDNGQILTSAGLSSGIDLCLHMIRNDYGAVVAATIANFFVMPIEREGKHTQRIRRNDPQDKDSLLFLQLWLLENMHADLTLESVARQACMSPRTLNRKFKEQSGFAPMIWLTRARIRRAQALLESSTMQVEQIATATGFHSAAALRENFHRIVGVPPTAWRKTYGQHDNGTSGQHNADTSLPTGEKDEASIRPLPHTRK